jgi:hypothetical protein
MDAFYHGWSVFKSVIPARTLNQEASHLPPSLRSNADLVVARRKIKDQDRIFMCENGTLLRPLVHGMTQNFRSGSF